MVESVRDFVNILERAGELRRVTEQVSPVLEISAITDLVSKSPAPHAPSGSARRNDPRFHHFGGQAILFENVKGSSLPVLINAMGSYRRMELALGCHEPDPSLPTPCVPGGFDAWAARIAKLIEPKPPASAGEAIAMARRFAPLLRIPPKRVRSGPCQEVVLTGDDIDLSILPIIKCWPLDGDLGSVGWPDDINADIAGIDLGHDAEYRGRFITLGGIHTIHAHDAGNPRPSSRNIGMYRVQLLGRRRMAMHWHMHHDGARHWRSWKRRGEPMPVAIVLGGESVLPYAATAPLPPGMSELLMAGLLNGRGIPLCPCRTVPLRVPANAEIVIEGHVSAEAGMIDFDPRESDEALGPGAVVEGPFGDHTGFYSLPDRYPILDVTAITMRRNAIYPTTIVGLPPQEDYYMGKATERIFLPLLRTLVPDIEDYDLPMFGAFHNCAFIRIDKEYPLQGRRIMHAIWGAGQMAWTKHIVVVDADVDVHDAAAVLRAVGEHCDPSRDIEQVEGPLDILDHAAPRLGAGGKLGFDATRKITGEEGRGGPRSEPAAQMSDSSAAALEESVRSLEHVVDAAAPEVLGRRWLLICVDKTGAGQGRVVLRKALELVTHQRDSGGAPHFVVVVDGGVDPQDFDAVMFRWCANSDPGRDSMLSADGAAFGFDASTKMPGDSVEGLPVRAFPPILQMDKDVVRDAEAFLRRL